MNQTQKRWAAAALTLLWIAFIFCRSLRDGTESTQESNFFLTRLLTILPGLTAYFVRKAAHFTEYLILGALLVRTMRAWEIADPLPAAFAGLLVALTDETIQRFVPGRSGSPIDVWLDFSGVVAGLLLVWLIRRLRKRSKKA
ncbi:MAG: VanZ family protein [Oscillospiraceae bacterium]|nr:VanZ family protein [Oscillospiraceae bacterium]